MAIIEWSEDMRLGIETLDEQHKDLMQLIDTAYHAVLDRDGSAVPGTTPEALIRDMRDYALSHFELEESHMRRLGYPRAEEHAFMHKEFLRRLAELERPSSGSDKGVDVFLFLADWLRTHILREDLDFGDFVQGRPPASSSSK